MIDRAETWGVLPRYFGFRGDVIETKPEVAEAILAAMGAQRERPPSVRRHKLPGGRCAPAPDSAWGWAVQLYADRSRDSWGIGDFADLRRLGRWATSQGASVLLISPLGAQPPGFPQEACPYYASSRRFLNLTYMRIEDVEGAHEAAAELEGLRAAGRALNSDRLINHDDAYRLKKAALELIFKAAPEPKGLGGWVRRQGPALRDFAVFNAITERHGHAWRNWPDDLKRRSPEALAGVQREMSPQVAFHQWVQFHLDRQLEAASKEISLIADVPVGFAADGFDAWRWQHLLAPHMRVGAPPDYFFPDGQDWGMPPFDPWKLRKAKYEPFLETIRSVGRYAAGLRLDHVMGLFRLFWIPAHAGAADGAYVRYPSHDLVALLAEESRRTNTFIIGEDLGIVEPSMRTRLRNRGVLSYKLLFFEEQPSSTWPRQSVAAVGTHDLPTIAGIWNLTEPDQRQHHLRRHLVEVSRLPDEASAVDVATAAYGELARSPAQIVLAALEDALGVNERPNEPGTTTERPNWRLALPPPLEEIEVAGGPRRIADAMNAGRPRRPRSRRTMPA